ncbi:hypothetical protein CYY_003812 [Polysphondylium violaceum]|uniref:Nicotinamide-nucleotide adenylyltransferase n=1 Tax=Polysphondylium violaceum TaxID=133409 RepID=A0A8J4V0V1_9MYCE|nr:hypothetical protein CYY_003812 [Polysphondylium violaceum]
MSSIFIKKYSATITTSLLTSLLSTSKNTITARVDLSLLLKRTMSSTSPSHTFPTNKLNLLIEPDKKPLVLLTCGSFNPVTYMHLRMMEIARDKMNQTGKYQVIGAYLSPVGDAYKKATLIPAKHRIEMLELGLQDSDWMMMDIWESNNPEFTPTRIVMDHIKDQVGKYLLQNNIDRDVSYKFVCGADLLGSFNIPNLWAEKDMDLITSNEHYGVVCLEREGTDLEAIFSKNHILTKNKQDINIVPIEILNNISSTKIREKVKAKESVKYLIPDKTIDYIKEHKLYQ